MQCSLSTSIPIEEHNKIVRELKDYITKLETSEKLLKEQVSILLHKLFG
ncbi:MAG: hypothetical protein H7A23_07075 [Leptospiraceae bacterium]|nr:hypothetical protein [Leptospiraceae bacterium]MCP5494301.1 hypothetical protein [Leptospiraceae bacterium]